MFHDWCFTCTTEFFENNKFVESEYSRDERSLYDRFNIIGKTQKYFDDRRFVFAHVRELSRQGIFARHRRMSCRPVKRYVAKYEAINKDIITRYTRDNESRTGVAVITMFNEKRLVQTIYELSESEFERENRHRRKSVAQFESSRDSSILRRNSVYANARPQFKYRRSKIFDKQLAELSVHLEKIV